MLEKDLSTMVSPPTALATNRCTEKEPRKPRENVKKWSGAGLQTVRQLPTTWQVTEHEQF